MKIAQIFFIDTNYNWIFSRFPENPQVSIFMKIRPVRDELFHADGQTSRR